MKSENNMTMLFFTCLNTVSFHMWKYRFYLFQIYSDFTACNKIKASIVYPQQVFMEK